MFHRDKNWVRAIQFGVGTIAVGVLALFSPHVRGLFSRDQVDFSRDIRPIFNQNCVSCHGGVRQKNGVSFIYREDALGRGTSGRLTIVPGDPDASELIRRVTSKDPDQRMPYHAPPLSAQQISLLRRWIKEGANWKDYWAFVPPKPQALPEVKHASWVRQPLDRFVLARLEKEGLEPSAEADKAELLRRASLDLTGLPPTGDEMNAYWADHSPNAYEKQVDRLLASPRYGERWAAMWLDLARYADTKGYEADLERPGVWPYRDWVIDAFNRNLPYDQFVVKQLAGDLLPNATFEDLIATSFHRQSPDNDEGGTDDEEFRTVAVMDRVATTWSVLNGITMNCVQCHSHPYDPLRHTDYYKSLAFFNTQEDWDLDTDWPNLTVPKDKQRYYEAAQLENEIASSVHSIEASDRQMEESAHWEPLPIHDAAANEVKALEAMLPGLGQEKLDVLKDKDIPAKMKTVILDGLSKYTENAKARLAHARITGPARTFEMHEGEAWATAKIPPQSVYELVGTASLPAFTALRVEVVPRDEGKSRHTPENGFIVDKVEAWQIRPGSRKEKIAFRYFLEDSEQNLDAVLAVQKKTQGSSKQPKQVDPSSFEALPKLSRTRWLVGIVTQPVHLGSGSRIEVDLKQTKSIDMKPVPIQRVSISVSNDPEWTILAENSRRSQEIDRLKRLKEQLATIPSVPLPVMVEQQPYEQRASLEFERGNFLTKVGPALQPDVPAIFPKLAAAAPRNRLTLAKWFFMSGQPLTARVTVNRYWEELFGTGIVETLENFGSTGEQPSHPELLDWLALHFQNDLHWDTKALLRELVTSATYRQRSAVTPELKEKDPNNRLLARGPQQRLTAEMVRDQALVASGLLSTKMGGPPVMPPQPAGIWNSVSNYSKWIDATGPDRYRRAIYTYIKRTSGYPSFLIFDASDHETSLPRRIPTNTPLQALVTLNDPVYHECAQALAQRVIRETSSTTREATGEDSVDALLVYEARLVLSRAPTPRELDLLRTFYEKTLNSLRPPALMNASTSNYKRTTGTASASELRALTAVATVLFNLDSALTR